MNPSPMVLFLDLTEAPYWMSLDDFCLLTKYSMPWQLFTTYSQTEVYYQICKQKRKWSRSLSYQFFRWQCNIVLYDMISCYSFSYHLILSKVSLVLLFSLLSTTHWTPSHKIPILHTNSQHSTMHQPAILYIYIEWEKQDSSQRVM